MHRLSVAAAMIAILVTSTAADARPRHHHRSYHAHHGQQHVRHARHRRHHVRAAVVDAGLLSSLAVSDMGAGRPRGAPSRWCGWWLRMRKGITNAALDAVSNWRQWGSPVATCTPGAVAVIRPSHVGEVVECKDGGAVVLSGNHGHRVGVGFYSARKIVEYRG